ncbi:MAG: hypothetical protein NVS1B1_09100 [Candidatus Limnocylindrales bacterium]
MSALEFLAALTQLIYVLIVVVSLLRAERRPAPANIDIALLFGATTYVILQQRAATVFGAPLPAELAILGTAIAMALPSLRPISRTSSSGSTAAGTSMTAAFREWLLGCTSAGRSRRSTAA